MDCSMPDFPVFCYLPEIAQICGTNNSMDTSWWWTGRPGVLQFMGLQRVGYDWVTELNWTELSQWYHPTISSFVAPFSSCLQSFPTSGAFQMSQFFASGGQTISVSASASVLPMNMQDRFPLEWTDWISLQSNGPQQSSPTPQFKNINSWALSFPYSPTLTSIHDYWKNHSLD